MKFKDIDNGTEHEVEKYDVQSLVGGVVDGKPTTMINIYPVQIHVMGHPLEIADELNIDIGGE